MQDKILTTEDQAHFCVDTRVRFDVLGLFLDRSKRAYSSPADVMSGVFQMIRLFGTFPGPVFGCIIADRCNYIQCHVFLVSFSESFSIGDSKSRRVHSIMYHGVGAYWYDYDTI